MDKQPILTLTAKDFVWDYFRGSGKGGQKRNKTSSAVRCRHLLSGAYATCEAHREQSRNKRIAFEKTVKSQQFQKWLKIESARRLGLLADVDASLTDENLLVEHGPF